MTHFKKILHCWKAYGICYKTRMTIPTSPYSRCYTILRNYKFYTHMKENANKLHFECTDFNFSTRVTVYTECNCVFIKILFSSLNTMLIVEKHCCNEFPLPQIDRKSKQVKEQ